MKKTLSLLLAVLLTIGMIPAVLAEAAEAPTNAYADQYIDLSGEWHFKDYRKYSGFYQMLAAGSTTVTWSNDADAPVPTEEKFSQWETLTVPAADYATGGLMQKFRDLSIAEEDRSQLTANDLFPGFSEGWFCRTIEIPAGFLKEDKVTLLLSVIDDVDVVYVNGTPVGQSGFLDAAGAKSDPANVPALGGFDLEGDWRFEKSYWEIKREYAFDASLLHEGKNEICVRLYNNLNYGGFYDGTMALVSTHNAVKYLKGLPIEELTGTEALAALIDAQIAAIEGENIDAYAATLWEDYNENELDKAEKVAAMAAVFEAYDNIQIEDQNEGFFRFNGETVYYASRVITGTANGEAATIESKPNMIQYLMTTDGGTVERGNISHCYSVTYASELEGMNGRKCVYSVYLPPSYYESDKSYPVVYLLHGINSTGDSFLNVDHIEARMNEWIASGDVQEMIVVMPNAGKTCGYEDTEAPKGVSDAVGPWNSYIWVDIRGQIEANYRTLNQKEFRGVSGISMGGGGVMKVGYAHLELYSSFAHHMGSGDLELAKELIGTLPAETLKTLDFYVDCGYQDSWEAAKALGEYYESIGANVYWELREGGHNSAFYMAGMPKSMKMHSDHFVKNGLLEIWSK